MKKNILGVAIAAALISSSLMADYDSNKNVYIGANAVDAYHNTGEVLTVGYGYTHVWGNKVVTGFALDFQGGRINGVDNNGDDTKENIYGAGVDLKLGYTLLADVAAYGILSGVSQSVGDMEGAGFGYGGGIEYAVSEHFIVGAEYKRYDMVNEATNYDYSIGGLILKYAWK